MSRLLLTICFVLIIFQNFGQEYKVSGTIKDLESGETIIAALVQLGEKATITNNYGWFHFDQVANNGPSQLKVQVLGYETSVTDFLIASDTFLVVELKESIEVLDEIIITPGEFNDFRPTLEENFSGKDLSSQFSILGEPDITRTIQILPSVQNGREGDAGLFVRGGTPDQNLFLLDNVPVLNVTHLGGFASVFNGNAIKNLKVWSGAFPAKYNGRVSSVIDIQTREANKKDSKYQLGFGLISSRFSMEKPLKKDKSSVFLSARRLNLDLFSRIAQSIENDGYQAGYFFEDFHLKYHSTLNNRNQISYNSYFGRDVIFINNKYKLDDESSGSFKNRIQWGNFSHSILWNHQFKSGMLMNTTLGSSQYAFRFKLEENLQDASGYSLSSINYRSTNGNYILRVDFEDQLGSTDLSFGYTSNLQTFIPLRLDTEDLFPDGISQKSVFGEEKVNIWTNAIYLQQIVDLPKLGTTINWGLNLNHNRGNQSWINLEPRLLVQFSKALSGQIFFSYARSNQFTNQISNNGTGIPVDVWIPIDNEPVRSDITTIGYRQNWRGLDVKAEFFYKHLRNLQDLPDEVTLFSIANQQNTLASGGSGEVHGAEFQIDKKVGKFTGTFAYTWSKNNRTFQDINNGVAYPFRYDRRHQINLQSKLDLSDRISLGWSWSYHSGDPITIATGRYDVNIFDSPVNNSWYLFQNWDAHEYSDRNSARLPSFHRLDVNLSMTKFHPKYRRVFSIAIFNVYNRQNPYYVFLEENQQGVAELKGFTLFPIIPSVALEFFFK